MNWKYAKYRQSLNLSTKKAIQVSVVPEQLARKTKSFSLIILRLMCGRCND